MFRACLCALILTLAFSIPASAHRVNLFAWVEGDTVLAEANFGQNREVKKGEIVVQDAATGREILRGPMSPDGTFSFPIPGEVLANPVDLRLIVQAGEGHQSDWVVRADEYAQVQAAPAPSATASVPSAGEGDAATVAVPQGSGNAEGAVALNQEELASLVGRVMDEKLAPIKRLLAEEREQGPTLRDIAGGLGWIVGLAGIGLWASARRTGSGIRK